MLYFHMSLTSNMWKINIKTSHVICTTAIKSQTTKWYVKYFFYASNYYIYLLKDFYYISCKVKVFSHTYANWTHIRQLICMCTFSINILYAPLYWHIERCDRTSFVRTNANITDLTWLRVSVYAWCIIYTYALKYIYTHACMCACVCVCLMCLHIDWPAFTSRGNDS